MIYYEVIEKRKNVDNVYEIKIANFSVKPKAGQYVSLILPSKAEIPLGVGDYDEDNNELRLYVESEKLANEIGKRVILKGPLGKPLDFTNVRIIVGIAYGKLYHDLLYPLKVAYRSKIETFAKCIDCKLNYEEPKNIEDADLILVSAPLQLLYELKIPGEKTLVYNRWVKMNCNLGVCGLCEVKGKLTCIDGPFMRFDDLVDYGKGVLK
ncbi:2-polyprenylphenol hydroxylase [Saccharolobus solfataricus]|uniref:2-polyprenylphenol hydroxylase n=3 Tax=Saccharolobus solfataricus TaxID=2287 RepID=Q7LXS2_SACS2|nr:hypothetical protein [Saccharolobus solfataricus]AAK40923.1 Hypothetical protein SSO0612 [Saccharolobus solfataricus P2]AKA73953.1 2-polyprenylphenol hydroxylase [Saccharolobus solfataricus]AKA76650.1 2-polyprenylphenol hydroxylase [Saccharolobus solfataricus]AKA79344.1 2-polyprenylphenol hydroxylase [Saccharolobus solfataricus]AZF68430.1 2-polyprenylphenol hydroxylase [Saccharolobus solfataricus]